MIIEIRGVGFVNKGAELMLYAILDKVSKRYPQAEFAMAPNNSNAPYEKRAELKLLQKAWYTKFGIQWGRCAGFIPKKLRHPYGMVCDSEIDIVLDASGFSYSDQCGSQSSMELARYSRRWKKNGTKLILLPQAFGPFTEKKTASAVKTAVDNASLVFAREKTSFNYLADITGEKQNIQIAPDFTNLLECTVPENFDQENNRFCIVPNYRMIDKTPEKISKAYLPFLIKCTEYLFQTNRKPFILIHESKDDHQLAESIRNAVDKSIPVIRENHPVKIKGVLSSCEGCIASRFHGLVSALSQGIPSLATSWSHKYQMLFEDYGFEEGLMDVDAKEDEIRNKIDMISKTQSRQFIKNTIASKSKELKKATNQMWNKVFEIIEA